MGKAARRRRAVISGGTSTGGTAKAAGEFEAARCGGGHPPDRERQGGSCGKDVSAEVGHVKLPVTTDGLAGIRDTWTALTGTGAQQYAAEQALDRKQRVLRCDGEFYKIAKSVGVG